jgi:Cu+-exporting ATPase
VRISVARGAAGVVVIALDGVPIGEIALRDPPRPEAAEVLAALRASGLRIILATGDAAEPAREAAAAVGLDDVRAGLSPEDKRALVLAEKARGAIVAVLGDGVNDAPALAAADVGAAFGGADLAAAAAGVALAGADLGQVLVARKLGRRVLKAVRQNLAFAFAYNLVMLPFAAGVFYPATGSLLDPMWAGGAMALSSVTVVLNSLRIR